LTGEETLSSSITTTTTTTSGSYENPVNGMKIFRQVPATEPRRKIDFALGPLRDSSTKQILAVPEFRTTKLFQGSVV